MVLNIETRKMKWKNIMHLGGNGQSYEAIISLYIDLFIYLLFYLFIYVFTYLFIYLILRGMIYIYICNGILL